MKHYIININVEINNGYKCMGGLESVIYSSLCIKD